VRAYHFSVRGRIYGYDYLGVDHRLSAELGSTIGSVAVRGLVAGKDRKSLRMSFCLKAFLMKDFDMI
jgi:hypothetical protein